MHRMRITQKGKKMNSKNQQKKKEIDWMITLVPLALIVALCIVFFFAPEQSNQVLGQIRFLFGDTFGTYYLVIGLGIFFLSLFLAGSKYGNIVLGKPDEKPKYSFFAWGCMMFTCGLAADILFYSFSEWILYATDPHIAELGSIQNWAGVFPLFHWSFIPWGFYGYSPYFPSDTYNRIIAWYGDAYYTGLRITNTFGTPEETKQIFNAVDEKLASIYKLVNNSMTDEQKVLVIHDYLVSHAEYDLNYKNYTSYGVLMDGRGVCQSYALAYMYILNHLGIENPPWLNGSVQPWGILMDVPLAVPPILCYHKTRK